LRHGPSRSVMLVMVTSPTVSFFMILADPRKFVARIERSEIRGDATKDSRISLRSIRATTMEADRTEGALAHVDRDTIVHAICWCSFSLHGRPLPPETLAEHALLECRGIALRNQGQQFAREDSRIFVQSGLPARRIKPAVTTFANSHDHHASIAEA
jgi:hypothetical protein